MSTTEKIQKSEDINTYKSQIVIGTLTQIHIDSIHQAQPLNLVQINK